MLSGAIENHLLLFGSMKMPVRALCIAAGIMLAIPEWHTDILGIALGGVVYLWYVLRRRSNQESRSLS